MPVTVAVLAGGRSRRMGAPKALADFGGAPLIARPLAAARAAGLPAVVVAKRDTPLPALDAEVWLEPDLPVHPLTGLVHALERAEGDVIALGCDMPFVTGTALQALRRAPSGPEPLLARYGPEHLPALRDALAREAPLRATFAALHPEAADVDPACLRNVNTSADLAAAEAELLGRA